MCTLSKIGLHNRIVAVLTTVTIICMPIWGNCHFLHSHLFEYECTNGDLTHFSFADQECNNCTHDGEDNQSCPVELEYVSDAVYFKVTCNKGCCHDFHLQHDLLLPIVIDYYVPEIQLIDLFQSEQFPLTTTLLKVYYYRGPPLV